MTHWENVNSKDLAKKERQMMVNDSVCDHPQHIR